VNSTTPVPEGLLDQRKLRWSFWLVLFGPTLLSIVGNVAVYSFGLGLSGLFAVNILMALPMNFVCSNWSAKQLVLLRDSRGGKSPWMFLWGPPIFFLNLSLCFGGCTAVENIARTIR
jgi:hypothetical protein